MRNRITLGLALMFVASCGDPQLDSSAAFSPTITGISPALGPSAGGTNLRIEGRLFCDDPAVDFDEAAATVLTASGDLITAATPKHSIGRVKISVTCDGEIVGKPPDFDFHATDVTLQTALAQPENPLQATPHFWDVDLDGRDDLVYVHHDERRELTNVAIHRYVPRLVGFEASALLQVAIDSSAPLHRVPFWIGDLGNDGVQEVIVLTFPVDNGREDVTRLDGTVYRLPAKDGTKEQPAPIGSFSSPIDRVIALADINGDTLPDLITTDDARTYWLAGKGKAGFASKRTLLDEQVYSAFGHLDYFNPTSGAARIDLNEDRLTDLLLYTRNGHHVVFGDRDAAFVHKPYLLPGTLIYFDDDPLPDRVEKRSAGGTCWLDVYLATAAAEYKTDPLQVSLPCDVALSQVIPLNFDHNIKGEPGFVFVEEVAASSLTVALFEPGAAPVRARTLQQVARGSLALADLEGNGRPALMLSARGELEALHLEHGFDQSWIRPLPPVVRSEVSAGCSGDFTGDGVADLLLLARATKNATLLVGPAPFTAKRLEVPAAATCRAGHFNGDEQLDFVADNRVYFNEKKGKSFSSKEIEVQGIDPSQQAVVDLNQDGIDDLVFEQDDVVYVFAGRANGPPVLLARTTLEENLKRRVYGDLDRDGTLDMVAIKDVGDGPKIRIYMGEQHSGQWRLWSTLVLDRQLIPELASTTAIEIADMNNDDVPDLVVSEAGDGPSAHYLLQWEDGRFVVGSRLDGQRAGYGAEVRPVRCDLDGNGRLDLLLTSMDGEIGWSQQRSDGALDEVRLLPFGDAWAPRPFGCADFTGDGLIDVALIDQSTRLPYLLINGSQ